MSKQFKVMLIIKRLSGSLKSAVRWDFSAFVSVEESSLLIKDDMSEERLTLKSSSNLFCKYMSCHLGKFTGSVRLALYTVDNGYHSSTLTPHLLRILWPIFQVLNNQI